MMDSKLLKMLVLLLIIAIGVMTINFLLEAAEGLGVDLVETFKHFVNTVEEMKDPEEMMMGPGNSTSQEVLTNQTGP